MDQITAAHPAPIDEVIAFAVALDPALDSDLVIVDRQPAGGVVEDDSDLGERGARAALSAGVDDLFHLPPAKVAGLAGAQHPLDRVDDVGLARAVRTDDRRHAAFEQDLGRPGEGLETHQAQRT